MRSAARDMDRVRRSPRRGRPSEVPRRARLHRAPLLGVLLVSAVLPSAPLPLGAQDTATTSQVPVPNYWSFTSSLGYAGVGFGVGVLMCSDCDISGGVQAGLAAAAVGLVGGYLLGRTAERRVADGAMPPELLLWGVRLGTVLGFASLGTVVAGGIIAAWEGNEEGDDEKILIGLAGAGAVGGAWIQYRTERRLKRWFAGEGLRTTSRPRCGPMCRRP